jgi:hypothetical protein
MYMQSLKTLKVTHICLSLITQKPFFSEDTFYRCYTVDETCSTVQRQLVSRSLTLMNFFCGLECVGHSFAYVTHFVILKDVWIRTQRLSKKARELIFREDSKEFLPVKEEKRSLPRESRDFYSLMWDL